MMRGQVAAVLVASFALAGPVSALECLVPSVERDYWWYQEQPGAFTLVYGQFSNLQLIESVETRETSDGFQAGRLVFRADFTGFKPSRRAFDQPFSTRVTLVFPDESFIGGGFDTSGHAEALPQKVGLVWLQQTASGYEASASSCSDIVDTDRASIKPALRCLRGSYCPKPG
jgi:hypothetical protein